MPFRRRAVLFSLLFLFAIRANGADEFVGQWGGTIDGTWGCANSRTARFSMGVTMNLTQNGSNVSGSGELTLPTLVDSAQCVVSPRPGPVAFQISGTANGSSITVPARIDNTDGTFTMSVVGPSAMGFSMSFPASSLSAIGALVGGVAGTAPIITFTANPSTIVAGGSATLSWSTTRAESVSIDNGVGPQPLNGSVTVSPRVSTKYILTAVGSGGTVIANATVDVTPSGPRVAVATLPIGMLQASGESGATDSSAIANIGTEPSTVTLSKSGDFFTIAPMSFTLQAGGSQSITITASAQPPGTHDGSVTVNGDGVVTSGITVPVHLLVAAAPAGTVRPQPQTARIDVAAPAGQNPSGSIAFTNTGSAAMIGIAVSDVPWIVPESGTITINPGETKNVTFSIDRSRRPDASSLFGGATGSISLRFLGGATTASAVIKATTPTSTVTVTIVDVVKPGVTTGAPPPLGLGELALFVASHGSSDGILADLLLANRSTSSLSNLRLFLSQSSLFASLPNLGSNLGVTLPSVSTSIFGVDAGGSLMLRGSVESLVTAALRMVNTSGSAAYTSAIPVFRSDQGVGPGGRIVLTGVDRIGGARTVVVVQELSGNSGSVELQGYDANGAPLGAKVPIALSAFYSVTDDALTVVEGTRSIVITNTGSGSSRVNAYARVRANTTPDSWIVVDPSLVPGSDAMIMPMISTPAIAGQTDIYVTNTSNSTVSATLDIVSASTKRRAVVPHAVGEMESTASQQLSIRPLETIRTTVPPSNGYIRLTGTARSTSASARVTMTSGDAIFGSALPVLAASSASGSGQLKRFTGVGDSSARTIAAETTATFRSSLMLIETAGQNTTVRVTVRFLLTGALVTAQGVSSKEFSVGANQMIVIPNLARSIIGTQRDSFGDLRDMQVDVEVIGASGRVLSYVQSIDNGSADVVIRTE